MAHLVIDLEAVLADDVPVRAGADPDRLPAAPHWRIVCLQGLWLADDLSVVKVSALGDLDELAALLQFATIMNGRNPPTLADWNGRGFDAPVIEAGFMRHGIQCPRMFSRDVQDRFYQGHIDLMDRTCNHGAATRATLDAFAKLIGLPGKMGCDGSQVAEMVADGRIAEVRAYCLQDVVQCAGVFMRREFVRGAIDLATYHRAAQSLLALIESTLTLQPMLERIDRVRFLLTDH